VIDGMPALVVSVHDVAASTAGAIREWTAALDSCGVALTFLAVPGPWRGPQLGRDRDGRELAAWLRCRQDRGDEIAVHGWLHRADIPGDLPRRVVGSAVARGCAELWTADRKVAAARTVKGLEVLRSNGLAVLGSTPPGWLSSRKARAGLAEAGLQYVTDHAGLLDLASSRRWWAPALCHRPACPPGGCAAARPGATAVALERLGRAVVEAAPQLIAVGTSVRIGVHPDDLRRPGLLDATVDAVRQCLVAGAEAITYAEVLNRLRARP
jgi:predicted deacetylase